MKTAPYRCINQDPTSCGGIKNQKLSEFLRSDKFGRIIEPSDVKSWQGKSARCPDPTCGNATPLRVCPNCNSDLARDIGNLRNLLIGVHGDMGAGKSVSIGVLIKHLKSKIFPDLRSQLTLECPHSEYNYRQYYHDPIYIRKFLPPPTQLDDFVIRQPLICRTEVTTDVRWFAGWKRKVACNVAIYDAAGEATLRQETFQLSCASVKVSDGFIVLIDPLGLPRVREMCGEAAEPSRPRQSIDGAVRVIERITQFRPDNGSNRVEVPTAFVLTKSDELARHWRNHESFKHEQDYTHGFDLKKCERLSTELKGWLREVEGEEIVSKIEAWFPNSCLFAASSLGQRPTPVVENGHDELRVDAITPKRLEEPFLWILNQHGILSESR